MCRDMTGPSVLYGNRPTVRTPVAGGYGCIISTNNVGHIYGNHCWVRSPAFLVPHLLRLTRFDTLRYEIRQRSSSVRMRSSQYSRKIWGESRLF